MALQRNGGGGGSARTMQPATPGRSIPGTGGRAQDLLYRMKPKAIPGLEKLQGLVKRRGPAPDVDAQMAQLEDMLADRVAAGPQRGGQQLRALAARFGSAPRPGRSDGVAHVLRSLEPDSAAEGDEDGLKELLELIGQAGQ